ncbi:MAG: 30S ribosomal protein S4 [Nanoarchaeota archaeon]|nr:30S ribosomal protein S4 [Nanoarchaeota archaeon]MBU4242080.1 30S ribosomal protein S4 [Nanoarchaeota archaeon]MBU4351996.1 30S ribosomal protein S4 [Nanoarchaeota archaeon]MBU4455965.1 30S ribosomal protein S4 [Nanoarchaeota archaeon]MCG2720320.1 30S ribosomal protein S4 [Nanoarchaeota archaeon]
MGDPRKQRKKYNTPGHPWQAERINREAPLLIEYGLKNKKELWKMGSILQRFKSQTKDLIKQTGSQTEKEQKQLLDKLIKMGLIEAGTKLENILDLNVEDLMARRLQTLVLKKGLAKTIKQARQFIVHGHILIGDKKITVPSYIVLNSEEHNLNFRANSSLSDEEHPERKQKEAKPVEVKKVENEDDKENIVEEENKE